MGLHKKSSVLESKYDKMTNFGKNTSSFSKTDFTYCGKAWLFVENVKRVSLKNLKKSCIKQYKENRYCVTSTEGEVCLEKHSFPYKP